MLVFLIAKSYELHVVYKIIFKETKNWSNLKDFQNVDVCLR